MGDTKKWYTSKTYMGIAVTLVGMALKLSGYTLGDAELTDIVSTGFQLVGLVVAAYGRAVASKKIS